MHCRPASNKMSRSDTLNSVHAEYSSHQRIETVEGRISHRLQCTFDEPSARTHEERGSLQDLPSKPMESDQAVVTKFGERFGLHSELASCMALGHAN